MHWEVKERWKRKWWAEKTEETLSPVKFLKMCYNGHQLPDKHSHSVDPLLGLKMELPLAGCWPLSACQHHGLRERHLSSQTRGICIPS